MDQQSYSQVKQSVRHLLNIDLTPYKDEQMRRRLDSWLVRTGKPSWPEYFQLLRGNTDELAKFRNYLTINVSAFFRDAERWVALRTTVLPKLLADLPGLGRRASGLRIWSAGCSIGPEPYSLAMLLEELAPGRPHYLLATDLDRGALSRAQARGPYSAEDIQSVASAQRARHFEPGGPPFFVNERLARRVVFKEHNMLVNPFESGFDLVVCRNVVIYFTEVAKAGLYRKFQESLRPGGMLFVGGTELISQARELGLQNSGIAFYQRA